jgi:hypothetical protein
MMARLFVSTRDKLRQIVGAHPVSSHERTRQESVREVLSHEAETSPHDQYLTDAPSDGKQYARQDGTWVEVVAGVAAIAVGEYYFNLTGADPATELGYGVWTLVTTATIIIP